MKKHIVLFLVLMLTMVITGCSSTAAHRASHQGSINENLYVTKVLQESGSSVGPKLLPHMQQQMKHLMTTREWLGPADTEVPHDHAIQEQYRSQAELDTQAAGIVGQLWDKAKQNWPWLGLITVLGGVARKFYGQYKTHETVAKRFIVGIQDAKNAARENGGAISPEALNGYLTTATSLVHDPKVRAAAKDLVKTTKDSLRDVKKEIDAVRGKDS